MFLGGISQLANQLTLNGAEISFSPSSSLSSALEKALEGGGDLNAVTSRLIQQLGYKSVFDFSVSGFDSAQKGQHTVKVCSATGADAEEAAANALSQFAGVLKSLTSGKYTAHISMVETSSGSYVAAIDLTVVEPGGGSDDDDEPVTLTKITATDPTKTVYEVNESFEPAGMVVTAHYSDGSTKKVTDYTYSPTVFTSEDEGKTVVVTIRYGKKETQVSVQVNLITLKEITATAPTKTEYNVGDTFDPDGMEVTACYSDGSTKKIETSACTFNPNEFTSEQAGQNVDVTVSYTEAGAEVNTTVSVTVRDPGYYMNGDTYMVYNADGLQAWAEAVNGGAYSANCTLTSDINLSGITWETVCYGSNAYSGVFDGDNHTISNLNVKKREWNGVDYSYSSPYGLFGNVGTGGTIKDVTVSGSINLTDRDTIGMIAGKNCGQIINCHSEGSVSGKSNVGGIAGYNEGGTIEGCTVSGNITAKDEHSFVGGITGWNNYSSKVIGCSFDNGTVNGNNYVGGIVASNNNGSQIIACYAKGTIQGSSKVGGVVGNQLASTKDIVIGCYFTGSSTGNEYVGGVAGLNELAQCLNACYWNGSATGGLGVGQGNLSRGEAEKVSDDESWDNAVAAMNTAISSYGYRFGGTMSAPSLSN